MAENTNENVKNKFNIEKTRALPNDEVASAKILFQEGLIDEAKKVLFRVLMKVPNFKPAIALLAQIQLKEEKLLLDDESEALNRKPSRPDDRNAIEQKLFQDLGLESDSSKNTPHSETWISVETIRPEEYYDLGVAFFEMDCFLDAIRELRKAEKRIRLEGSFLGSLGVAVVALIAECLHKNGDSFQAKAYLAPVLSEPEIRHEEKIILFYVMGLIDSALGNLQESKAWFQKVINQEPDFRDAAFRLQTL